VAKAVQSIAQDQLPLVLQAVLADRFKLILHRETREVRGYLLLPVKQKVKLHTGQAQPSACFARKIDGNVLHRSHRSRFCSLLSRQTWAAWNRALWRTHALLVSD
jgi:uncharacterized protein (TIGR03435 family)